MENEFGGIPGFTIEDEQGNVVVHDPGQTQGGRRIYRDGLQQDRSEPRRKAMTHNYLLRAPRGLWKAFSRKCNNEGLTIRGVILFLVKDWTTGKIEIQDLATRKKI